MDTETGVNCSANYELGGSAERQANEALSCNVRLAGGLARLAGGMDTETGVNCSANYELGGSAERQANEALSCNVCLAAGLCWFQVKMYGTSMWMHSLLGTGCFYIRSDGL